MTCPRCTLFLRSTVHSILIAAIAILLAPFSSAQTYTVTDLGTFTGGSVSQGNAINNCGQVVGYARFANYNAHGFAWTSPHGIEDIGSLPPETDFSVAQSVNSSGVIAGYSTYNHPYELSHAVIWINGQIIDLGGNNAQAMGINDAGQVVGFDPPHAFLWSAANGTRDLAALPGGYSQALSINQRGDIVGYSDSANGNAQAVLWKKGLGLQTLPFLSSGSSASANAINQQGEIAGGSSTSYSSTVAVLWNPQHQVQSLGVLPGQGWSSAFALNNHHQVVGWSGFLAFLWSPTTGMQDLNSLIPANSGWSLSLPLGINDFGQITGQGTINGQSHAFLLTPVNAKIPACK